MVFPTMDLKTKILYAEETYGLVLRRTYRRMMNSDSYIIEEENARWKSFASFFMTAFLPHGYPNSVSKDYIPYQLWDSIQAFSSSITGSIATHAVLKGVGVGDESATALAATVTWLIKDGTSMVGRILFAWFQGTKLDSDCKKWRLFADVLNDGAMFLDLISAHFKGHFTLIICVSGLLKSIVGVAGGATRAALTQHQARANNMADVSAKDGSQETLVNLAALICSLLILPTVTQNHLLVWLLFMMMTMTHLLTNYFAVKSVIMETFNMARFRLYMDHYLQTNKESCLSVEEVNKKESVILFPWKDPVTINLGTSFHDTIKNKSHEEIEELRALYEKCDYFLTISQSTAGKAAINVCLNKNATVHTQLEAMYQACLLVNLVCDQSLSKKHKQNYLWKLFDETNTKSKINFENFSRQITIHTFYNFKVQTEKHGWSINTAMFDADLWRVKW